jgi:myo-inositol-1(or 4)-monophosphatase
MSKNINPQTFVDTMLPVVRQCAQASLIFFGRIAHVGKSADATLGSSEARHASEALTAIDSAVQDIILSTVLQHFPTVYCIAEENTALKRRFKGNKSPYAVILDPIDGTLHFTRGDAPYHISLGLAHEGRMQAAIVARPSEDKIFTAVRGQGAYVQVAQRRPKRLRLPARPRTNQAFISSKARPYQQLARPRLEPREHPIGAALVLTLLAEGELAAYMTRQVEVYDVGPPSLIAEEAGGRCSLGDGREPLYRSRRKFAHYISAANEEIETFMHDILRRGKGMNL